MDASGSGGTGADLPDSVRSLIAAVEDHPDDLPLRLLLAELLIDHGRAAGAASQCTAVLERDPASAEALRLLARATQLLGATPERDSPGHEPGGFDWSEAEAQVEGIVAPAFVDGDDVDDGDSGAEVDSSDVRLADVGGMEDVKRRLDTAFLLPMRNPELRKMYGRSLPGGMLLYGPPGCGKTFLARAIAGELGAGFHAVALNDVLDMWIGSSERNLHEAFETARRNAPCVLFLDEIDALGQKRAHLRASASMRSTVNQLLAEMDSGTRSSPWRSQG